MRNQSKLKPVYIDGRYVLGYINAAKELGCAKSSIQNSIKNGHKCKGHTITDKPIDIIK